MQSFLHIRTLSLATGLIALILFLCVLYISRSRKIYAGFHHWTTASLFHFLGMLLLGFRNILPDFISIVLSNILLSLTYVLIPYGVALFADRKPGPCLFAVPVIFVTLSSAFFTYYMPCMTARIVVISTLIALGSVYCILLIRRSLPSFLHSSNLFLEVSFGAIALWSALRIVMSLVYERQVTDLMSGSLAQGVSLLVYSGLYVALFLGLIVLNFQRVEHELSTALAEVKTLKGIIPICASCKKIRDDRGYWNQVESYIRQRSEAEFSHGLCPECIRKLYPDLAV